MASTRKGSPTSSDFRDSKRRWCLVDIFVRHFFRKFFCSVASQCSLIIIIRSALVPEKKTSIETRQRVGKYVKAKVIKPLKSLHFFLFVCRFGSFALSCRSENVKIITRMEEKAAERRKMRCEHAIKTNSFESV